MIIADVLAPENSWLNDRLDALDTRDVDRVNSLISILKSTKEILQFTTFQNEYWQHFPQDLTRGLGMLEIQLHRQVEANVT
jgi:hypothetical protein